MRPVLLVTAACAVVLAGCSGTAPTARPQVDLHAAQQQVFTTERAFAKTMADRDHAAFATFLADEAIFFGSSKVLRGKQQVADAWARFYEGAEAPFSWEPDTVEVLDSGTLALTSGPVRDPQGTVVARFNSIWRQELPGMWRVVFDKGSDVCGTTAQ
jgi:ketosteroid isomerase-like protein